LPLRDPRTTYHPQSAGTAARGLSSLLVSAALLVAFLSAILALIRGAFLAITPDVGTAAPGDTSAGTAIHDGWRFTGGLLTVAVGSLPLGAASLRARDGTDARGRAGGTGGVAVCLLGLALAVARNDALACLPT